MNTTELLSVPLKPEDIKVKLPDDLYTYLTTESSTVFIHNEPFRIVPSMIKGNNNKLILSNRGYYISYDDGKIYNGIGQVVYDSFTESVSDGSETVEEEDPKMKEGEDPLNEHELNAKTEMELFEYIKSELKREEDEGDYVSDSHIEQYNFVEHCFENGFDNVILGIIAQDYLNDYKVYFKTSLVHGRFELLKKLSNKRIELQLNEMNELSITTNVLPVFLCVEEYYGNKISKEDEDPFDRYKSLMYSLSVNAYNIYTYLVLSRSLIFKRFEQIRELVQVLVNEHPKYYLDLFMSAIDHNGEQYAMMYPEELESLFVGFSLSLGKEYHYF